MQLANALMRKIDSREARIGVIGLGYVGLPLAVEFANAGFHVTGIDVDPKKVATIRAGKSHVEDVTAEEVAPLVKQEAVASRRPTTVGAASSTS